MSEHPPLHYVSGIPAPRGLRYMPFQTSGIHFLANRTSALLADEQGLGKTIQAIGAINLLQAKQVLIVCPASMKYVWKAELQNWLTEYLHIQVLEGSNAQIDSEAEIVITNYDLLSRGDKILHQLLSRRFDVGVFDEAHYLKSHKTNRTLAVLRRGGVAAVCKRKWFLTGTPILNRPIELWPILKAAAPEVIAPFLSRIDFAKQFCGAWWDGLMWVVDGSSNETDLRDRLHQSFMLRRLKSQVLKDLPEKTFKIVPIKPSKAADSMLAQERLVLEALETGKASINAGGTPIAMHRREIAEEKVEQCLEYIKDELENVEKLVVFAYHRNVIDKLQLGLLEYNPVVIMGATLGPTRKANVDLFQTDARCRVFIGQIQAAGTGITLTAASNVIFVESSWVPGEILQATDRLHRIGQKSSVLATFLVVQGGIEEYMIYSAVEKLKTIKQIVEKQEK